MNFHNITSDPAILGGKPCIKGTRISVDLILEWVASGADINSIINLYPQLSAEAVREAINYAAFFIKNEILLEVKKVA